MANTVIQETSEWMTKIISTMKNYSWHEDGENQNYSLQKENETEETWKRLRKTQLLQNSNIWVKEALSETSVI